MRMKTHQFIVASLDQMVVNPNNSFLLRTIPNEYLVFSLSQMPRSYIAVDLWEQGVDLH